MRSSSETRGGSSDGCAFAASGWNLRGTGARLSAPTAKENIRRQKRLYRSMPRVPLLDLKAQYASIRSEVMETIARVCESQYFILGPEVTALEEEVARFCGIGHAVGVSSGTDALLAALMAIDLKPGDEVITAPYSFFATAGVVARLGGRTVFVDIEPQSFNLDPRGVEKRITDRTR